MHILLIDDSNDDVLLILQRWNTFGGIPAARIAAFPSLTKAKAAVDGGAVFDVALLDLGLVETTGLDTLMEFFRLFGDSIPVVVLTGRDDYQTSMQSIDMGAADFMAKGQDCPTKTQVLNVHNAVRRERVLRRLSND